MDEMRVEKRTFGIAVVALIVVVSAVILLNSPATASATQASKATLSDDELSARFAVLDTANSNSCGGTFNFIDSKLSSDTIRGSCCGPMDKHRYMEQVRALVKYSQYDKIPSDPYNVSVSLAKELLDYQKTITLTLEQQAVYDEAVKLSHEGGPCCCKCWHWYAYEGLAKYLIVEEGFGAEQIAEIWDMSDACGGNGHSHSDEL